MKKQASSVNVKQNDDVLKNFFQDPELRQRAKEEFLANMNHDLRTPLNAVIGFAQIIENEMFGKVQPQYLEYAKHIQESGYDLLSKIEDLIDPPSARPMLEPEAQARPAPIKRAKKLALAE